MNETTNKWRGCQYFTISCVFDLEFEFEKKIEEKVEEGASEREMDRGREKETWSKIALEWFNKS